MKQLIHGGKVIDDECKVMSGVQDGEGIAADDEDELNRLPRVVHTCRFQHKKQELHVGRR